MFTIVKSSKSFAEASAALEKFVAANGFGVLHIHNLGETLRAKGQDFSEECRVFEVCNPVQASKVLSTDMKLNMALPCRISVYTENGQTMIGFIDPEKILSMLSDAPALQQVASEVQAAMTKMIQAAV